MTELIFYLSVSMGIVLLFGYLVVTNRPRKKDLKLRPEIISMIKEQPLTAKEIAGKLEVDEDHVDLALNTMVLNHEIGYMREDQQTKPTKYRSI